MGAANCSGSKCCMDTGQAKMTCCDLQQDKIKPVSCPPQPPAGFSYYNATTKESQNPTHDHRASDWQHVSKTFNEKRNPSAAGNILKALTSDTFEPWSLRFNIGQCKARLQASIPHRTIYTISVEARDPDSTTRLDIRGSRGLA